MPLTQLAPPYPIFTDKNGDPLDAGYLYFGVANLNPETNPIQVYYDRGFTQPVAQPVRTSNGYVMRNGSPALIYANDQFSITVRNKNNELVIYSPVGFGVVPGIPFATFENAAKDVAALLADTEFTYSAGIPNTVQVAAGDILRTLAEGFAYAVAASGATDQNLITAGGVKLYVLPDGPAVDVRAVGCKADGVTPDQAALQAALTAGIPLMIPADMNVLMTSRVIVKTGSRLYGPGRITWVPSSPGFNAPIQFGANESNVNVDVSDVRIEDVEFYSVADEQFLHFISLRNIGGDITDVSLRRNRFIYNPATRVGTGDRWAISFGGFAGDERQRIFIEDNYLQGGMQLTGNGQSANYSDISICRNYIKGSINACIALSRLAQIPEQNTYKRIDISDNHMVTDVGNVSIFLGGDSEGLSTSPQSWEDIRIANNFIEVSTAGFPVGILFRAAPSGSISRVTISGNTIRSAANAGLVLTYSPASTMVISEVIIGQNSISAERVDIAWPSTFVGNTGNYTLKVDSEANQVRVVNNSLTRLRLDGASSIFSSNNIYNIAENFQSGITVNNSTGTVNLTSTGDTFRYIGTSGAGRSGIVIDAAGTVNANIYRPVDANVGAWGTGQVVATVTMPTSFNYIPSSGPVPTRGATGFASATDVINTNPLNKFTGSFAWDDTNRRLLRSRGAAATSPWDVVDGSATVTPV